MKIIEIFCKIYGEWGGLNRFVTNSNTYQLIEI